MPSTERSIRSKVYDNNFHHSRAKYMHHIVKTTTQVLSMHSNTLSLVLHFAHSLIGCIAVACKLFIPQFCCLTNCIAHRSHLSTADAFSSSPWKTQNKVFIPATEDMTIYIAIPQSVRSYTSLLAGPTTTSHPNNPFQVGPESSTTYTPPLPGPSTTN